MAVTRSSAETLQRAYEVLNERGIEAALEFLDRDIEFVPVPGWLPDAEHFHGHDGGRAWFAKVSEAFEIERWEPQEYIEAGDRLVIAVRIVGRSRATAIPGDLQLYQVWTVRDGKAVRMEAFLDRGQALEAATQRKGHRLATPSEARAATSIGNVELRSHFLAKIRSFFRAPTTSSSGEPETEGRVAENRTAPVRLPPRCPMSLKAACHARYRLSDGCAIRQSRRVTAASMSVEAIPLFARAIER
jgi:ketosteroid isomerase-like protein